ncbi:hypothetical protein H4S02_011614, partial [Coemansia sp. RSA 2611]
MTTDGQKAAAPKKAKAPAKPKADSGAEPRRSTRVPSAPEKFTPEVINRTTTTSRKRKATKADEAPAKKAKTA